MATQAERVAPMDDWGSTAAQAGGAFALVLGGVAAIGKALAWLLNWQGERSDAKSAKLQAWEDSLDRREKDQRTRLEARFARLEGLVIVLRDSLLDVTVELRLHDPQSAALAKATEVLRGAFPPEFALPADMMNLTRKLDGEG